MSEKIIYLDNNATTPLDPEVLEVMKPFYTELFFNPSSAYSQSHLTKTAIDTARAQIAATLGAVKPSEVVFTGCASESNNAAIKGALQADPAKKHIVTSSVEHPSVYELCKDLQRQGYEVTFVGVNEKGELSVKELIKAIRPDTAIVSVMHANNETGVIYPVDRLARVVKEADESVLFHTDATQSVCKVNINLADEFKHVDLLTFSGHKIHAPKGIGVLYIRRGSQWRPTLVGGHQEKGRRAGTENVPYIVGLAKACGNTTQHMLEDGEAIKQMRDELEAFVVKEIPAVRINGEGALRLVTTSNISFQGIEGEAILYALNEEGVCVSTGSACSSGSLAPSHVLQAMEVPFSFAHGSIRFSFSFFSTRAELEGVKKVLPGVIASIRKLSPFWDNKNNVPLEGAI